jgi:O-succinylbenzoic acid--CoA ligase
VLLGGAAAPRPLLERAQDAGLRVVRTYGSSETSGGCVYDGVALDGVDVDIRADGRISVGGPVLFRGYRLDPGLTAAALVDGRYVTDDIGRLDRGRLTVLGRADDVVVTGGENVPAALVERTLSAHPGVADVAVVGLPDPEWGERVVAVVVARDRFDPPSLDELRHHARGELPAYALPRELAVLEALPLLPSGKVDRSELRAVLASLPG